MPKQLQEHATAYRDSKRTIQPCESGSRVTELEQEVALLRKRNEELTDFMENAPIGLHWVGQDGTILWVNQAELDVLGYEKGEYVGHHIAEFHEDRPVIEDILKRLQASETLRGYAARLRAKDGSTRNVLINSNVLWDNQRFVHTRCITRDVTDRIRAEEDLKKAHESLKILAEDARKREELLRAALLNSPIAVFHQNADLRYTWAYTPYPESAAVPVVDKGDFELFPPDQAEQLNRLKLQVLSNGEGVRRELPLTIQGQLRVMDVRIQPFRDSSGKLMGILGTAVDVTERKRNEQRLLDSLGRLRDLAGHLQVLREKERALTSHEVHNLGQRLTALHHQLSVSAERLAEGASPDGIAERLKAASGLLGSTIESSARISTNLRPSLLDNLGLAVALDWHVREFGSRTGIRVTCEASDDVRPDPDVAIAIFRILQDALTNVERHSRATEVRVSLLRVGNQLVLRVSDNGTGISSARIADPGSLGLLAMRELALLCGGTIEFEDNQGATVSLAIPLDARMSVRVNSGDDPAA